MRYVGTVYRPPSEHDAFIVQATYGCSWNKCTYCAMYTDKTYSERNLDEVLEDLDQAAAIAGDRITKVFVADGDALGLPMSHWRPILRRARENFPALKRVSCYAMATNITAKTTAELTELQELGLTRLYVGPESGDDVTLKRIAKGSDFAAHVMAAEMAHAANIELSVIALLGAGGLERSEVHASETARLVTEMDPQFFAALTLTVVPDSPLHRLQARGRFVLPDKRRLLGELRTMVAESKPTRAMFRTNHASNYLPLRGYLPQDQTAIVSAIDEALSGRTRLRPEWARGL